jgi:peptidyl-tRNA hydrolase, PTH1 family
MKMIVGLGNPGKKYEATPHNLGFRVVETLAARWGGSFIPRPRERAEVLETSRDGESVALVKPLTFMNLSGEAVRELIRQRPLEHGDLLVVSDDFNLETGRLRIRDKGSHGGHNGLRSVIDCLGTEAFPRLRIGVRPNRPVHDWTAFVLSSPRPDEREQYRHMVELASDAVELWLREGSEAAANRFNGLDEFKDA